MTNASGTTAVNGDTISLTFGNGVTGTYTQTGIINSADICVGRTQFAIGNSTWSTLGANNLTFLDPDPPAGTFAVNTCIRNSPANTRSVTNTMAFNKSLIGPIFHTTNLDTSSYQMDPVLAGGGTSSYSTIIKNNAMELGGTGSSIIFNSGRQQSINDGCMANDSSNPNGACGSFRITGGPVTGWTSTNTIGGATGGDSFYWTVSFQLARLTKAFNATTIMAGAPSTLTFTIDNTNATNGTIAGTATALSPLDFTDVFPAGLVIANTTTGGTCTGATFQDASGGALNAGDTGVRVTGFSVPANATCTVTVNVTSNARGTYVNNDSNMSSTIGNLVLAPNATLTVNTPSITVRKQSLGNTGSFGFSGGTNGLPASLSLSTTAANPQSSTAYPVNAINQDATIAETVPAGWALTGWACTSTPGGTVASGATTTATVPASVLAAGNDLVCTFTNQKVATLTLRKQWTNAVVGDTASVDVSMGATLLDTLASSAGSANELDVDSTPVTVNAGSVLTLAETLATGNTGLYNGSLSCTGTSGLSGTTLTVGGAEDAIVCTYTNARHQVNLSITKTNTPGTNNDIDQASDTVESGGSTIYTLTVTNNGPDPATGAVVTDQPSPGLTCPGAGNPTSVSCTGAACTGAGPMTVAALTGSGITLGTLANGASVSLSYTCAVD